MASPKEQINPHSLPRLLLGLMSIVILAAFLWFFITNMRLLNDNLDHIRSETTLQVTELLNNPGALDSQLARLSFLAKSRVALEHDAVLYRHQRASSALMTRTWLRFMSLAFGILLVATGSLFVLGRIPAPQTNVSAQLDSFSTSMASGSPGLVLALLGCVLIGVPNIAKQTIGTRDHSAYMQRAEDANASIGGNAAGNLPAADPPQALVDDLKRGSSSE